MSDEKKGGKVILTSTPNLNSDGWLDESYMKSLHSDPETFKREYLSIWTNDKPKGPFAGLGDSMSKAADAFRGVSRAMTAAATTGAPMKKLSKEDLDKTIADMKTALSPEPKLRGRDRIREALRQQEKGAAIGEPTPRQAPKPPSEIDRGSEWGSW